MRNAGPVALADHVKSQSTRVAPAEGVNRPAACVQVVARGIETVSLRTRVPSSRRQEIVHLTVGIVGVASRYHTEKL